MFFTTAAATPRNGVVVSPSPSASCAARAAFAALAATMSSGVAVVAGRRAGDRRGGVGRLLAAGPAGAATARWRPARDAAGRPAVAWPVPGRVRGRGGGSAAAGGGGLAGGRVGWHGVPLAMRSAGRPRSGSPSRPPFGRP